MAHIVGDWGREVHFLACQGVAEPERTCVESLPVAKRKAVVNKLPILGCALPPEYLVSPVSFVVEERMAESLHMDPYLVGSSRLEAASDNGDVAEILNRLIVCYRMFAVRVVGREDTHLEAVLGVASDIPLYSTVRRVGLPPDNGHILAARSLVEELATEVGLGVRGLGDYEEPGGVLVDTVYESEAGISDIVVGFVTEVPGKGVYESPVVIAMARVDYKSCGLVNDQYGLVLIDYIEVYILRCNLEVIPWSVHYDPDDIEGFDAIVGFYGTAIDEYTSGVGSLLDTITR